MLIQDGGGELIFFFGNHGLTIVVLRGCAPFGQHQEWRPLAGTDFLNQTELVDGKDLSKGSFSTSIFDMNVVPRSTMNTNGETEN